MVLQFIVNYSVIFFSRYCEKLKFLTKWQKDTKIPLKLFFRDNWSAIWNSMNISYDLIFIYIYLLQSEQKKDRFLQRFHNKSVFCSRKKIWRKTKHLYFYISWIQMQFKWSNAPNPWSIKWNEQQDFIRANKNWCKQNAWQFENMLMKWCHGIAQSHKLGYESFIIHIVSFKLGIIRSHRRCVRVCVSGQTKVWKELGMAQSPWRVSFQSICNYMAIMWFGHA